MAIHLNPENCYVCGYGEEHHSSETSHTFWSNAQAEKDFEKEINANSNAEARYVEEYRPY
jgi:hypothetical protein